MVSWYVGDPARYGRSGDAVIQPPRTRLTTTATGPADARAACKLRRGGSAGLVPEHLGT
ncbi:hypothetical protein C8T65DRAFT_674431, partial [Cerioporus squamosus]